MQVLDQKEPLEKKQECGTIAIPPESSLLLLGRQLIQFSLVGGVNTFLDLLIFNILLWCAPTSDTKILLIYNSIAYLLGGLNSFFLNKYWTFRQHQKASRKEIFRFAATTCAGIVCNNFFLWLISSRMHPLMMSPQLWANISKIIAIFSTVLISFVGMRLWVFVQHPKRVQ